MSDARVAPRITEADAQAQLREALAAAGVDVARVGMPVLDGQRHYVPLLGQRGEDRSASYRAYFAGIRPAGSIMNYKTGEATRWKADGEIKPLSPAERDALEREQAAARDLREQQRVARQDAAAQKAQWLLDGTRPASPDHPYLTRKGVQPHGAREDLRGNLVVPLHDAATGALRNLQTIAPDGTKLYLGGAQKVGVAYAIGRTAPDRPIAVAEGFATAASVHEATGLPVAMALDTSNLKPVALALRSARPDVPILLAADNDAHLPARVEGVHKTGPRDNAGLLKAQDAADAVGGQVLLAPEIAARTRDDKGTDWNDVALARGREAVAAPFLTSMPRPVVETPAMSDAPALPQPDLLPASVPPPTPQREPLTVPTHDEHLASLDRASRERNFPPYAPPLPVLATSAVGPLSGPVASATVPEFAPSAPPPALPAPDLAAQSVARREAFDAERAYRGMGTLAEHHEFADRLGRAVASGAMTQERAAERIAERMVDYAVASEPDRLRETLTVRAETARAEAARLTPDAQTVHEAIRVVVDHRLAAEPPDVREALKASAAAALERRELVEGPVTLTPAIRIAAGKPPEPDPAPPMRAQTLEEFGAMARAVREHGAAPDRIAPPAAAETRQALQEMFAGAASVSALGKLYAEPDVKRSIDAVSAHPEEARLLKASMEAAETRVLAADRARHGLGRSSLSPVAPPPMDADPATPALTLTRRGDNGGPASAPPAAEPVAQRAAWDAVAAGYVVRDRGEVREYYQRDNGQLAMRSTEGRIDGVLRDARTIGAMLDLAASRGWNDVQIAGDRAVARDTWIEATARGLRAEGYTPTREDVHAVNQRRAERRAQGLDAPDAPKQAALERQQRREGAVEQPRADRVAPAQAERPAPSPESPRPGRGAAPQPGWTTREGGYDALPPAERAGAERSYETWTRRNPELGVKHSLPDYVVYVQEKQAELRQELKMPPPKVKTPRMGVRL